MGEWGGMEGVKREGVEGWGVGWDGESEEGRSGGMGEWRGVEGCGSEWFIQMTYHTHSNTQRHTYLYINAYTYRCAHTYTHMCKCTSHTKLSYVHQSPV